jgi:hypothetical protein
MEDSEKRDSAQTSRPGQGEARLSEKHRGGVRHWLLTALVCLAVSAAAVIAYDRVFAVKVGAVDLKGFISQQRELVLAKEITEEQFKDNVDRFERVVLGIPENHVVIMGDAVVRNAPVVKIGNE